MPIYLTLYEGDEERVTRGPDLLAASGDIAMERLQALVETGEYPDNIRLIGEYNTLNPNAWFDLVWDNSSAYLLNARAWRGNL